MWTNTSTASTPFRSDPDAAKENPNSAETDPEADESIVVVSLTVRNVDYNALVDNTPLRQDFESAIRKSIVREAGGGVLAEHVQVHLSSGSVKVRAVLRPPRKEEIESVLSSLAFSSEFKDGLIGDLLGVEDIKSVSTGGDISVTDVQFTRPSTAKKKAAVLRAVTTEGLGAEEEKTDEPTPADDEPLPPSPDEVEVGMALRPLSGDAPEIYESADTYPAVLSHAAPGSYVRVTGEPVELALKQKWLVPIAPQGLVELSKFCKAEGLPSGAIDLSVMIQHGKGLKRRFIGTPTLWVDCLVAKKPGTSFQTSKIKAMDAAWQEEWQIMTHDGGFELGDTLEFKVMDKETEMATGRLVSQQVFPYGYDDFLPLSQAGTSLRLTISYAGQLRRPPEKRQSRMKRASTFSMGDSVVAAAKAPGKDVGQDEETMSDPGRKTSKTSEATADAQDEPAKEISRRTKLLTKIGIIGETETRRRANTDSAALKAEQRRQTQPLKAHAPLRAAPRVKVADPDSD